MKILDKEIMRVWIHATDEYDLEFYNSLILKDGYILYSPSKVKNGEVKNGIYLSGRFERIKIKRNEQRFDFNLN